MTKLRNKVFYFLLSTFLLSCKTVKIDAPEEIIKDIPPVERKMSNLSLPVEIDLTPYFKDIERSIDKTIKGKEENCSGVSYSYKFERNPIIFNGKGAALTYEVTGKYALNLNYCPECTYLFDGKGSCVVPRIYASCGVGEPMRRVKVAYATQVDVAKDYRLKAFTQLSLFETLDPCEITVFKYDATAKLKKEVTTVLKDLEKEIDKSIGEVDIRSQIEEVWSQLNTPQELGNYGFLHIQPRMISVSSVKFDKKKALIDMNLGFEPLVSTSRKELSITPLPALSEHKKGNGFEIFLDVEAQYDSLSNILTRELSGRTIELKKNLIRIDEAGIASAANNRLNIWVKFSGKKKGVLYLVGTPTFNLEEQIISMPDLEFDIKTKNALLKSAEWLFSGKITDLIRKEAVFDLKPELEKARKSITEGMNGPIAEGVVLNGKVERLNIESIFPSADQLIIRIGAIGKASIKM